MPNDRSLNPGILAALAIVALALIVWWTRGSGPEAPAGSPSEAPPAAEAPAAPYAEAPAAPPPPGAVAPRTRIAESGRLSVRLEDLREAGGYALGLALSDERRGGADRPVKVVDVAGRVLETTAKPIAGHGTGVRLDVDEDWLRPGRYMIQVETAEADPLALVRYVLEVE